jgi:hypothetical protein
VPLSAVDLAACVGAALVIVAVVEAEKAVRRRAGEPPASAPRDIVA